MNSSKYERKGKQVAMIGDGINDTPALAAADIGIAIRVAGIDVAIESAYIVLKLHKLMNNLQALLISKLTFWSNT